ncbi:DUF6790 family protein [Dongshaea marina]|uniref:DUF6790 family protein n=1 Tax=Dongshaea marina TaxID=2047966 RepID=UPI000D3E3332|nr:DUF6790 family protein [Dongshaea marina]
MLIKLIETVRIAGACLGIYFAYRLGMDSPAPAQAVLHIISPWLLVSIAGISGVEGLLFPKLAAKEKGFEQGSNYQRQSAIALLSYAAIALLVYFADLGTGAEIAIVSAFAFFILFSAVNHAWQSIAHKNYRWANLNRPFLTIGLLAALWYPLLHSLLPYLR